MIWAYIAIVALAFFVGAFIGLTIGVLFYIAGIKRGIGLAMHDALVMAGVIEGDTNDALSGLLERAKAQAMKPKPISPREEWEREKKRLHDAGIY